MTPPIALRPPHCPQKQFPRLRPANQLFLLGLGESLCLIGHTSVPASSTTTARLTAYFLILNLTQPSSALESSTLHTHNLDGSRQQRDVEDAGLVAGCENLED